MAQKPIRVELLGSGRRIDAKLTEEFSGTVDECKRHSKLLDMWPTKTVSTPVANGMIFTTVLKNLEGEIKFWGLGSIAVIVCPECGEETLEHKFRWQERVCDACAHKEWRVRCVLEELRELLPRLKECVGKVVIFQIDNDFNLGGGILQRVRIKPGKNKMAYPTLILTVLPVGVIKLLVDNVAGYPEAIEVNPSGFGQWARITFDPTHSQWLGFQERSRR